MSPQTIKVTLADAPTDVLVYLVDHSATVPEIARAVAPRDADSPLASVANALRLLREIGYAQLGPELVWTVTDAGRAAVDAARRRAATGGDS